MSSWKRLQVVATRLGKMSQRIATIRYCFNCDARQVHGDAPEIASFRKVIIYGCQLAIGVKYVVRYRLEVVDERQVNLGMSEIRRGVSYHSSVIGTDEVVLLSVAVKQRRRWLWTAEHRQSMNQALQVSGKVNREVAGVNRRPE